MKKELKHSLSFFPILLFKYLKNQGAPNLLSSLFKIHDKELTVRILQPTSCIPKNSALNMQCDRKDRIEMTTQQQH